LRRVLATISEVERQLVLHIPNVCVALGVQHAIRMRHIVICGLPGSVVFFHIISQTAQFKKKKKVTKKKCVF
jgi:hypothetical protein